MTRQVLGRGLDALLPKVRAGTTLMDLELESIRPNQFQPRAQFSPEKLEELAASIAANGVIQPIVVRPAGEEYEIVAGERRWRAAQKAGLERIPAMVQDVSDAKMVELALVENIQRAELSPVEEALAYQVLVERFHLTQEQIAHRTGRSRSTVTNTLRLLQLPKAVQQALLNNDLSMGHARALIPLPTKEQLALTREIVAKGLSVREVERRVQRRHPSPAVAPRSTGKDANVRSAEQKLEQRWKTRVRIRRQGSTGQILLYFHSEEELDRLYSELLTPPSLETALDSASAPQESAGY